jgi:hypothetical protein
MKQAWFLISLLVVFLIGCNSEPVSERLAEMDSLIVAEDIDSAYQMASSFDESCLVTPEDRAHYNLLKVQTAFLVHKPLSSDSLLDAAIAYYQQNTIKERLADAYYYKGVSNYLKHRQNQALLYYKKAEETAKTGNCLRQQYKVAEAVSFINSINAKSDLALDYAKQALNLAIKIDNKRWLADAYYRMGIAFSEMNQPDSAVFYLSRIEPYIKYVREKDKSLMLSNLGYAYLDKDREKAKKYLCESLSFEERTRTLEYLADIKYDEGEHEEAYQLWSKALTINDNNPKDNIIHNLLEYDIEHGKTDEVCSRVNEIIAIKDSIINKVKNDTIKDLQTRFDYQVAMNKANQRLIRWQWALGGITIWVLCLIGYILWRKHETKQKQTEYKAQIIQLKLSTSQYQQEINRLEGIKANAESEISHLQNEKDQNQQRIEELEREKSDAERIIGELKSIQVNNQQQISMLEEKSVTIREESQELDEKMKKWQAHESQMIRRGVLLYDSIVRNEKVLMWTPEDYDAFIAFYETGHYDTVKKFRHKYSKISQRNMFYLILVDMGKSDEYIRHIMTLTQKGIRSLRHRLNTNKEEKKFNLA